VQEKDRHCGKMAERFHAAMKEAGIDTVILANRFTGRELKPAAVQAVIDYWTDRYAHVVLMTPTPEFPRFKEKMLSLPLGELKRERPNFELRDSFQKALAEINLKGTVVIDSWAQFCGDPADCSSVGMRSLLVDDSHLSGEGALKVGKAIANDPRLPFVHQAAGLTATSGN
jgi:hypothetical protein